MQALYTSHSEDSGILILTNASMGENYELWINLEGDLVGEGMGFLVHCRLVNVDNVTFK